MELMPGYNKHSDVGVIPDDWVIKQLQEVSDPVRGGSPRPAGDPRFFDGSFIPWLTVAALTSISDSQLVVTETATNLTEEGSKRSRTLSPGTLIIANSGATLGVAKILGMKCCANDGIAALLNVDEQVSSEYLAHYINTKTIYLREVVATGNGQPNLNTGLIGSFRLPLPPTRAEQEEISQALSDVDELLIALDQMIAKKRDLKQAAMQQLLTGDIQLSGFNKKWLEMPLGEIVKPQKGQLITTKTIVPGDIPVIAGGKQPAYFHASANRYGKTITVSASGASAGYVAFHAAPIFASDCSTIGESEKYCIEFIYYALQLRQEEIYAAQTGGAQPHIQPKDLAPILIKIPEDVTEQAAIASVLSDMDAEITELKSRRDKTHNLKQAMMQELLTGKTRLV